MSYIPPEKILKKYSDVLINFALGGGKGIKKGEVVRVSASESAKPLYVTVCNAIVDAGGHVLKTDAMPLEDFQQPPAKAALVVHQFLFQEDHAELAPPGNPHNRSQT